ncbi:UNVERIFIED_CONTAM: hypothetical protein Sindi_2035900 [Sesamum indicum]
MAKTKKFKKPAENVATGQPSSQLSTATEPIKTAKTVQQPASKPAVQQSDATTSGKAAFSDFNSTVEVTPSFTKNDAPNSVASRLEAQHPTKDTAAENAAKKTA